MSKTVRLPDGRTMSVPDQASDEQIQQLVEQEISAGQNESPTMGERAVGVGETAATLASGAVAEPLAGLAGLGTSLYEMVRGNDDVLGSTVDRIESVREALTFQPRSEAGEQTLETVAKPFQAFGRFADEAGERASQARAPFRGPRDRRTSAALGIVAPEASQRREEVLETETPGSPAAGAAVRTAIEAGPMALGSRRLRSGDQPTVSQRRRDIREAEQGARESGVSLRTKPERQVEQLGEAGQRKAGDLQRGEGFEDVARSVRTAKQEARKQIKALYDDARGTRATLPKHEAEQFIPLARKSVRDFDVRDMKAVQNRLDELEEIKQLPENSEVTLNAIHDWRKRINANMPKGKDAGPEKAALEILKAQGDNFLEAKFNADMIKGDPSAVAKWRKAIGARKRYGEIFEDDKFIKQMAENNITPEEVKQWVFGASAAGMKKEASRTIRGIKDIVGERSPQFMGLRNEALLDITEPLLRDEPNLKAFANNYDKTVRKNPTAAKELFGEEGLSELRRMRDLAAGVAKRPETKPQVELSRMGSVFALGHGIARAGMKVRLGKRIIDAIKGKSNKRETLGEILGYDPNKPLIPKTPVVIGGAIQAGQDDAENPPTRQSR